MNDESSFLWQGLDHYQCISVTATDTISRLHLRLRLQ